MTIGPNEAIEVLKQSLCTGDAKGQCIVVLDRGWVFVGDLTKTDDGYILTSAKNIRTWRAVGFGGLVKSPVESKAVMDNAGSIRIPTRSMLFYAPAGEGWKNV